jgi:hypothetical protein
MANPPGQLKISRGAKNLRAFGWRSKKADEQRGKEMARQPPAKMLK